MNSLNINIVGVCRIIWANNGDFFSDVQWAIIADREKNIWIRTNTRRRYEVIRSEALSNF